MLNKDVLGGALNAARSTFNDQTTTQLIATYGSLDNVRLAMATADAEAIINHFTSAAQIPALGLVSPPGTAGGPVTGIAKMT